MKTQIQPISPEADRAKRGPAGELPPVPGVYSRSFVAPRPERAQFATESDYVTARDAWKRDYPNLHTAEEQAAHVADMAKRYGKGGAS